MTEPIDQVLTDEPEEGKPVSEPVFRKVSLDSAISSAPTEADPDVTRALAEVEEEASVSSSLAMYSTDALDLDASDIVWPRLRLAQGLSPEVQQGIAKPGQWVIVGQPAADQLTVVPLMFAKRRERADADFNKLCSSQDSKIGVGDPGGECSKCPMAQFTGPKTARKPPECALIYSYIVYIVEYEMPAMLEFKKTAQPAGKLLNTMVAQRGLGRIAVTIDRRSQTSKYGSFFVPSLKPAPSTPEMLAAAHAAIS